MINIKLSAAIIIAVYYIIINLTLFIMMGVDKSKAKAGKWRIMEAALLTTACLGGFLGGFAGMRLFHHKTQKIYFHIIFWLSAIVHILLFVLLLKIYI